MNGGIPSCSVGSCSNRFIRDSKGCAFKRVWYYRNYGAERRFSRSLLSNCVASSSIGWSSSRTSNRSFFSDSIDSSSVGWSSSSIKVVLRSLQRMSDSGLLTALVPLESTEALLNFFKLKVGMLDRLVLGATKTWIVCVEFKSTVLIRQSLRGREERDALLVGRDTRLCTMIERSRNNETISGFKKQSRFTKCYYTGFIYSPFGAGTAYMK